MRLYMHIFTAILAAFAIYSLFGFERIYLFGIIIGVMLPDIIEPATSRFHRRYWHSRKIQKVLLLLLALSLAAGFLDSKMFWVFFILLGYEIHLIFDHLF